MIWRNLVKNKASAGCFILLLCLAGMFLTCGFLGWLIEPSAEDNQREANRLSQVAFEKSSKEKHEAHLKQIESEKEIKRPQMNAAAYAKIQMGMTYDEVVAIVGSPNEELSRSELGGITTVMYIWRAGLLGNAQIMFQDDKAVTKTQAGL
jgi:hypothetical protein